MPGAAIQEDFATFREQLDLACDWLRSPSPSALDRCSQVLETAGNGLAAWQPHLHEAAGNAALLEEAQRLRASVVRAGRLLEGAADFHLNWLRLRGAMSAGYTDRGEPAPVRHGSRFCLEG